MNIIQKATRRIAAGLKGFAMRWGTSYTYWQAGMGLGRTSVNYAAAVGDGRGNAMVVACIGWLCRSFLEAPLRVRRYRGDDLEDDPRHALLALLRRPNPHYSGRALWRATLADRTATGNAYWLKVRSGAGVPVQLWYAPSWSMEPKWPEDGRTFVGWYEYNPGGGNPVRIDPADVVHFRDQLDPRNTRKGLSPLASLAREVFTDDEAANWTSALVGNMAMPGLIISPADSDNEITPTQADAMKAEARQKFGNDNRGEVMVLGANVKVNTVSFSPEQMNLRSIRQLPEERVSAVLGTPAVLVGLGAGLEHSIYNNYSEAREAAFEEHLIPLGMDLAEELMLQLVPDFDDPAAVELDFDTSNIRVLQEDNDKKATRMVALVNGGLLTLNQALQHLGEDALPNGDVLYVPSKVTVTPVADLGTPAPKPEPAPTPLLPVGREDADGELFGQAAD